jgi:hypothetical protein
VTGGVALIPTSSASQYSASEPSEITDWLEESRTTCLHVWQLLSLSHELNDIIMQSKAAENSIFFFISGQFMPNVIKLLNVRHLKLKKG